MPRNGDRQKPASSTTAVLQFWGPVLFKQMAREDPLHGALRESGPVGEQFPVYAKKLGCNAWQVPRPRHELRSRNPKKIVMDLLQGKRGCLQPGFRAHQFNSRVVRYVLAEIRSGRVLAVMMAPPCASFSIAQDCSKVIRPDIHKDLLRADERQKTCQSNACCVGLRVCVIACHSLLYQKAGFM